MQVVARAVSPCQTYGNIPFRPLFTKIQATTIYNTILIIHTQNKINKIIVPFILSVECPANVIQVSGHCALQMFTMIAYREK